MLEAVWLVLRQGSKLFMHFILDIPFHPLSCILIGGHTIDLMEEVMTVFFPKVWFLLAQVLSVITGVHDIQGLVLYGTKVIF